MSKNWNRIFLLVMITLVFGMPAWGEDDDEDGILKLSDVTIKGYYEIQGRAYHEPDITKADDTDESDQYIKHYFHVLPTLKVTEDIKIKGDIVAFENMISKDDTHQWYGYDSSTPEGTGTFDDYDVFRIDELYAMVTTDVGLFRVGKTAEYNGIGYFIEVPDHEAWKFGLIWNKVKEDAAFLVPIDTTHDNADRDDYALKVIYDNEEDINFDGTLAYRRTDREFTQSNIFMPYFYLDYNLTDDLILHTMAGTGTGVLVDQNSPVGIALGGACPAPFGGPLPSISEDWKVKSPFVGILGLEYDLGDVGDVDDLAIRGDVGYASGAKEPQYVSGYIEETVKEEEDMRFDTWLMNDVSDAWGIILETPATTAALNDPQIDGNYTYTNIIIARAKLSSQFTKDFGGWINVAWAQKQNVSYLENWDYGLSTVNAINPATTERSAWGLPKNNLDKNLGWEVHAGIDYQVQDNFTVGVDGCYYAPGDFYKDIIEKGVGSSIPLLPIPPGYTTGDELEDTYALRWTGKVTF
jgi:opacity protein-like surface antigen